MPRSSTSFRYPQSCGLARAAEVVGPRWTLLIVRELLIGSRRFGDLRESLSGVSPSVLADRLAELQSHGLVECQRLGPPISARVYALTAWGRDLEPVVRELFRFGARYLLPLRDGDRFDPTWLPSVLVSLVRKGATPGWSIELRARGDGTDVVAWVAGGRRGTRVSREPRAFDASLRGEARDLLAIVTGGTDLSEAERAHLVEASGDRSALEALPSLFDPGVVSPPDSRSP